jgi:hypothetical protein
MSRIAFDFFSQSPVLGLPILGLLLFFLVFTGVCVGAFRLPSAEVRERAALPLDEEDSSHG